ALLGHGIAGVDGEVEDGVLQFPRVDDGLPQPPPRTSSIWMFSPKRRRRMSSTSASMGLMAVGRGSRGCLRAKARRRWVREAARSLALTMVSAWPRMADGASAR